MVFCTLACMHGTGWSEDLFLEPGPDFTKSQLTTMADNLVETSVKPDQIPALYKPRYLSVTDASLSMNDDEVVFIIRLGSYVRIFPQRILVWHEIVNEELDGHYYSVAYSPLTGAVTGYRGTAGNFKTIFGVTGKLLNANTVMFDRATGSMWPQITGVAINGSLKGSKLDRFQVLWSRWGNAKKVHPTAMVLSRSTGFRRNYGKDPYGSYSRRGTYYDSQQITYPVMNKDNRLPPKERIVGIEYSPTRGVLVRNRIKRDGVYNFAFSGKPMVAYWDRELETVRIYERVTNGKMLEFRTRGNQIVDTATRSVWSPDGKCVSGILRGNSLPPVVGVDMMWFAWAAFYPESQILPDN